MDASEIYSTLGELRSRLEVLHAEGRLSMSSDSWNKDWPDTELAYQASMESLDRAISATTWMETKTV